VSAGTAGAGITQHHATRLLHTLLLRRFTKKPVNDELGHSPESGIVRNFKKDDTMERFLFLIDNISGLVGKLFAWCVLILTAIVCYEVFMRYVMRSPSYWAYDASYMLYGALFIMCGAYALANNNHVRGDVLYRLFPTRVQAGVDLTLYFIFFFPAVIALVYSGYEFARMSWIIGERSSFSPGGPPLYHFKTLIPLAGVFLFMQGVAEVVRCIACLRTGRWPRRLRDVEEIDTALIKELREKGALPDYERNEGMTK
jgi:TRAP-type mannitol/chloroaromatic compound transport system permease small subunit